MGGAYRPIFASQAAPARVFDDDYLLVSLHAPPAPPPSDYHTPPRVAAPTTRGQGWGNATCMQPGANADALMASCAARTLRRLATWRGGGRDTRTGGGRADTRPFFFAVGLHKPHVPWTVPQVWPLLNTKGYSSTYLAM